MTVDEQPAAPALGSTAALRESPATLLVPGLHDTAKQWEPLAAHLPPERHVLRPELPGSGRPGDAGPYSLVAVSERLASAVEDQASAPVDVVGHDWGATLAITLAATRPDLVRHLVVISGIWPPGLAAGPDHPEPGLPRSVRVLGNRPGRQETAAVRQARRAYLGADHAVSWAPKPERSLIIWGARDRLTRPRYGEKVVTALGRYVDPATVEMVTLPGVGHLPHITAATAVGSLLCDFLRVP